VVWIKPIASLKVFSPACLADTLKMQTPMRL
jgi:hypothetical protein